MIFEKCANHSCSGNWSDAVILIFNSKGQLLVRTDAGGISFPVFTRSNVDTMEIGALHFIGVCDDLPCFCTGSKKNFPTEANLKRPVLVDSSFEWKNLRALFFKLAPDLWHIAGYAKQINDLHSQYRFCSRCRTQTKKKKTEQARCCPECHMTYYPRISPAIIVAVVKENKILLARGVNFPNKKMFSVLAGFVEPQESLEDCVRREVFEETGIRVKNIAYFSSQPWPFPDSLMIGFTADYNSGSLDIDPDEIVEAGWFSADNLPVIPEKQALAGKLIHWFISRQEKALI